MESKVKIGWYILISSIIVLQSMLNYAQTKLYMKEGVFYAENDIKNSKAGKTLNKMFTIGESDKDKNCTFYNFMTFTTDDIGNIYVIDGRKTIMKYDKNGKYIMNFAGTGEGPGEFRQATKIFYKDKCIYLLDNILYRITKYSTNGKYISSMKITKLAVDFIVTNDNKYILHIEDINSNYKLLKYNQKGDLLTQFGKKEPCSDFLENHFFNTGILAIDQDDNVYLSHIQPYKIEKYDKYGKLSGVISKNILSPVIKPIKPMIKKEGNTISFFVRGENNAKPTRIPIDICVSKNKLYHVVIKEDSNTGNNKYAIDVFDLRGKYLQEINVDVDVVGMKILPDRILFLVENSFKNSVTPHIGVYSQLTTR